MGKSAGTGKASSARRPDSPRLLFLVIILFGHGAIIYFMDWHTHVPRVVQEDEFSSSPIYVVPIAVERREPLKAGVVGSIQKSKPRVQEGDETAAFLPLEVLTAEDPQLQSPAIALTDPPQAAGAEGSRPDWNVAAEVARQMARPKRKGFGEMPEENFPPAKAPADIFERAGPAHHAGDIEIFEQGIERRWISSKCYLEFGRIPDLFAPKGARVNPVHCFLGKDEVNGHLFDHLKPKYLRPRE